MLNTVSTNSLLATPRLAVADLQTKLNNAEAEMTSGEVADPVVSLGSKIGLDEALRSQADTLTNFQSTNAIVGSALTQSQNALTNISSDAQTFMNALITAQSSGDVSALAIQAKSLLDGLTGYANSASAGGYLFAGTNSAVAPMASYSGAPQAATAAAFQTAFGFTQSDSQTSTISASSMQSFLSGAFSNLFADPSWTTNWSQASSTTTSAIIAPGKSITTSVTAYGNAFRELSNAYTSVADLGINGLNSTAQQAVIANALKQVSAGIQSVSDMQTTLGFSQQQLTATNTALQTQLSTVNSTVSQLDGVDPYQAAEKLTNLTTQLETAYNLTSRISKLGLVNYLPA